MDMPLTRDEILAMSPADASAAIAAAKKWRIHDPGIGMYVWEEFRDSFGRLSVREKLRPAHWHRELSFWFMGLMALAGLPEDEELVTRVITDLMNGSRAWCNPETGVDDAAAFVALRTAFDQILAAQDSTSLDDAVDASQSVDVVARTSSLVRELGI